MKYLPIRIWRWWALKAIGSSLSCRKRAVIFIWQMQKPKLRDQVTPLGSEDWGQLSDLNPFSCLPHTLVFWLLWGTEINYSQLQKTNSIFFFSGKNVKYEGIQLICLIGLFLASVFRRLLSCQEQLYRSKTNLKNN